VGRYRFYFLIENEIIGAENKLNYCLIIVGLKIIKKFEGIHFAILRSYLKSINKKHGLLLNFSKMPLEIKRIIYA